MNLRVHHAAISVRNLADSITFYEKLGFSQVHHYDEPDGSMKIAHLKLQGVFLELFWFRDNENKPKLNLEYANNLTEIGVKHIALWADDLEGTLKELRKLKLADESTKTTVGRTKVSYFFIQDPDGVWVEFVKDERYK